MEVVVRILHLDDNYRDGGSVEMELERRRFPSSVRFVTKKADFLAAIARRDFDVILCDYQMAQDCEGDSIVDVAQAHCPEVPIILLAEPPEEEDAARALQDGATDYVVKDNLRRLVPAIERALSDARKSKQEAETEQKLLRLNARSLEAQKALAESKCVQDAWRAGEEKYRRVFDAMTEAAAVFELVYDGSGSVVDCIFCDMNHAFELFVGAKKAEHLGKPAYEFFGEVLRLDLFHHVSQTGKTGTFETYAPSLGRYVVITAVPTNPRTVAAVFTDITERKEMEEGLLKTQHRLNVTQEAAKVGIFDWDITTGQTIWSPELAKLFGISVPGHRHSFEDWYRLIHPDDRAKVERAIRDWLLSDRNEERVEYQIIRPDGHVHSMELVARLVRNPEGRSIRMIGTHRDITGQRRTEDALRRSVEEGRKILESIPDAFYSLDQDWRFTYINQHACELWGQKPEELIGKNIWEVFPSGADAEAYVKMRRVMEEGGEETFEMYSASLERWNFARARATDEGIAVYLQDVTERKKADASRRRNEQVYRGIGETINWGIWICDADGKNTYASQSFLNMVGMTQEECSEFGWGEVLHPDDADATIAAWRECSQKGSFWERKHRFKGIDGKYHHVLARGIPIRDEKGAITCWAGINLDVDGMMEREAEMEGRVDQRTKELVRANQELEAFSYSVSHDLKAPLRVISGFARLLLDNPNEQLSQKQREYLQLIVENTNQMNEHVNALHSFSRITGQAAHMTHVDVRSLVQTVVAAEQQVIDGRRALGPFCVEVGEMPPASADPVLLRQVFTNLLSNAMKFTRNVSEPRIEIGGSVQDNYLVYYVRDNGTGFPAASAPKLFNVFQRLHSQSEFEGTGLGLANVRKIIERHGGKVWAEGEEGKGATFFFALPRHSRSSENTPQPSTTP